MQTAQPTLVQRLTVPAITLGAVAWSLVDKLSGSNLFGDPTTLSLALGAGAASVGGFALNVLASKAWQDHTDRQRDSAIAAALLESGAITRHVGNILAALVTDAGETLRLTETAGPLADAIPGAWQIILKDNPQVREALDGPQYAHDVLQLLARTADTTPLDAEDIAHILRTAAATVTDLNAEHVTRLAQAVASRLAAAVADGLTSPHPDADRAFRRALLQFHAQTFAAVQESLALNKSADARLADLAESFDIFTDAYCDHVEGFAEVLTGVAADLTRVVGHVTHIRDGVTDIRERQRSLTALVSRMHEMLVRIHDRQTTQRAGEFAAQYVEAYRQRLVQSFSGWEEVEAPVQAEGDAAARRKHTTISDIFVAPACSAEREPVHPDTFHRLCLEGKHPDTALIPLLATEKYRRTVLLADPGFGKTTLLQYLIVTLAGHGELPPKCEALEDCIPIPLVVRDIVRFLPDDISLWRSWRRVLASFRMARGPQDAGGFSPLADAFSGTSGEAAFRSLLDDPRALFLIDGLDEIGDPAQREAFRDAVWEGFSKHPKARWLLTSRIVGYDQAKVDAEETFGSHVDDRSEIRDLVHRHLDTVNDRWPGSSHMVLEVVPVLRSDASVLVRGGNSFDVDSRLIFARLLHLAPFDDARQLDYAQRYFEHQTGATDHKRAHELIAEVCRHPGIHAISRVPSLLNLMAILKRRGVPLPDGRAELYSRIAETYLKTIDDARDVRRVGHGQLSHEEALRWLGIVAMFMQMRRAPVAWTSGPPVPGADTGTRGPRHATTPPAAPATSSENEDYSAGEIGASRADLATWLFPFVQGARHTPEQAEARVALFLDYVAARSGLLQPRGEDWFGFVHLSFLEYFAACYLQDEMAHAAQMKAARDLQGDDFAETDYLTQHPAGPIPVPASLLPALTSEPLWHETLVFLAERHAMTGATAAQQLENLCRRLFPPLFSKKPVPNPAVEDQSAQPLLPVPSVALAMRLASDRFLSSDDPKRASAMQSLSAGWYLRLWQACLAWPHKPRDKHGWPIAPHLLQDPSRHPAVLQALRLAAEDSPSPALTLFLWKCPTLTSVDALPQGVRRLYLTGCTGLTSVDALPQGVRRLYLTGCTGLTSVDALPQGVQRLSLNGCTGLSSVDALPQDVRRLYLTGCTGLSSVDALPQGVQILYLSGCTGLTNVDALPEGVQELYLNGCTGLSCVDALPKSVQELELTGCTGLTSVDALPQGVQILYLNGCTGLTCVDALPQSVRRLDLTGCTGLTNVDALPEGVQELYLNGCTGLSCVDALPKSVRRLDLTGCTGLTNVDALPAGLQILSLRGCTGLTSAEALPEGVQELYLNGCTGLSCVDALPGGLQKLNLRDCTGLTTVDALPRGLIGLRLCNCTELTGIKELPEGLTYLDLKGCTELERLPALPPGLKKVEMRNTPKLPEAVKAEIRALVKKNGGTVEE